MGRREQPKREAPKPHHPTPDERDERVKMPLPFEEALRGLLAVDPKSEPAETDDEDNKST